MRALDGVVSDVCALGFEEDVPGSTATSEHQIVSRPPTAARYGGVEFTLRFNRETQLEFIVGPEAQPVEPILVSALQLAQDAMVQNSEISGHQFAVGRAPGDTLPVQLDRDDLVLDTNEEFSVTIAPRLTGIESRSVNLTARLVPAGESQPVFWTKSNTIQLDENGSASAVEFDIVAPSDEGVYDLIFELQSVRYPVPFQSQRLVFRHVQFIALDPRPPVTEQGRPFETYAEIDPLNVTPVEQPVHNRFQLSRPLPLNPLGNDRRRVANRNDHAWLQLDPGGWHAVPVTFPQTDRPVEIEFEYDPQHTAALGVSLIEPDESGQAATFGFDSGLAVPDALIKPEPTEPQTAIHRFTVWPKSGAGYLLFANRDQRRPATLSTIRLKSGPARVPTDEPLTKADGGRAFLALVESPFFAESMGGRKSADPVLGQSLDDWSTFYTGTDRLIQQLKNNGFDGAVVTVASGGSSLFPSKRLEPTPRFDSGIFFSNGQDPIRKDVLRMMLKMFAREGLQLVPALSLTAPLPEIENLKRMSPDEPGIELVDFRQHLRKPTQDHLPRYNPLDVRVQKQVTQVVAEITDRYATQPSFAGVTLISRPESYTLLPGRQWCYDERTVDQFLTATEIDTANIDSRQQLNDQLLGPYQAQWIQWRLNRISNWYQQLAQTLNHGREDLTLFATTLDLHRNAELGSMLSPNLHQATDFDAVLRWLGIDPEFIESEPNVVLLAPQRMASAESLAGTRIERHLTQSNVAAAFFHAGTVTADLFHHHSIWAHFAEFQEQMPWRLPSSALMRMQPLMPGASASTGRFVRSLRRSDARYLVDGGWAALGDYPTDAVQWLSIYRRLPAVAFEEVPSEQASPFIRPVAIRQARVGNRWYFYGVNSSPWDIQLTLRGSGLNPDELVSLGGQKLNLTQDPGGAPNEYQVTLRPYQLVAATSPDGSISIDHYRYEFPQMAERQLRLELQKLQAKLPSANRVDAVRLIENQDFELADEPSLQGWMAGDQTSEQVTVDANLGHADQTSLKLTSSGEPVWIRSGEFRKPATGRLSLSVWIKTDRPEDKPPLRLAVEGRTGKRSYYRFGPVGGETGGAKPITDQWQRFAVHFDDLPVEGMDNLRIGFDLMGAGTVWIDEVRTYDHWFDGNDTAAMSQILAAAGRMLDSPDTTFGCLQILEGYWPRFLDTHFGTPAAETSDRLTDQLPATADSIRSSRKRRFLNLSPRKAFPFR